MNLINNVLDFVIEKHGEKYFNDHLFEVYALAHQYSENSTVIYASLLHDILEDTDTTYGELSTRFGDDVAFVVSLVTDKHGINRKERHRNTYPLIRNNDKAIIVKLADRIQNVRRSIGDSEFYNMYKKEYKYFRDTLYYDEFPHQAMWYELDTLMEYENEVD